MSGLKERLRRMRRQENRERDTDLNHPEDQRWKAVQASVETGEHGEFVRRRASYSSGETHGNYRPGELVDLAYRLDPMLVPAAKVECDKLLFLDTETTGLGVGTGNVPFMVGLGYFSGSSFVVEQCLIRNPAEEPAMLAYVAEKMREKRILVSYNGRAFDWPVLKNRCVLNRMNDVPEEPVHLDFLYASRHLWKHTLTSCRLSTVEEEKLGVERVEDVPGALAPEMYFRYLREKDPSLLAGVFRHNERDVLSLAALAVHFTRLLSGEFAPEEMEAEELYRLGVWLEKMNRPDLAERSFTHLYMRRGRSLSVYWERLASRYKKKGEWTRAVELWHRCIEEHGRFSVRSLNPYIELAKYYEHHVRDYARALEMTDRAREQAEKVVLFGMEGRQRRREWIRDLEHRMARAAPQNFASARKGGKLYTV